MNITDDDKNTTTDPAAEASETTDTTATENAETGSERAESEDGSPQGGPENAGEGNSEPDPGPEASETPPEGDTFDRPYVEKIRAEAAASRVRVKDLEAKLHRLLVEQDGQLADPADLEFDPAHLDDPEALASAIAALLEQRPHLKARRFEPGAAAQGAKSGTSGSVDLAGLMRAATM